MTNKIVSVLCALAFLILSVPALAADYNDKIEIDLKVKGSNDPTWENNLETSKVIMGPNVKFDVQMIIKNKDSYNQTWIKVKTFLPAVLVANSDMSFTIPDLGAGSEISKIFTVTLKDKSAVTPNVTKSEIYSEGKAESGAVGKDWAYFYAGGGTKSATSSGKTLPATGVPLILGSLSASAALALGFGLRKLARGY
ncbi:MAG: hypothetical protein WC596_00510 [Candidatus Shapirobacteria bacterium]